ncbi:alpha/beta hydrolase [Sulfitobacter sp. D35]|uniref:alpha/beta fold hydrolase n=1 Tax=Sulfitobacter sp. D35 TaxID=3083252 RepID=UPI00296F0464|nr:alpha/beta hydrolase [Sulfitobacter sp. D35]MDW4497763.1 alpha/beta hydrolase [Sulfitobacter sp. D35]
MWVALLFAAAIALLQGCAQVREDRAEAAYPPSGQFVEVDGTRIHARVMGQGPDLVLIHGASGSLRDMSFSFAQRLTDRYRVILLDRPGMGWSDRPDGYGGAFNTRAESPAVQARLLQAAAAQLGAEKPIVLGHSYGGAVALAWALDHPDNAAALVLVSAVSEPWPGGLGTLYEVNKTAVGGAVVIPVLTATAPQSVIEDVTAGIFEPQAVPAGYLAHVGPDMSLRRASMRANAQQVGNLRPYIVEMSARYPGLNLPVEIVHGTADEVVPARIHSERLVTEIPGARLTRLQGIGHMPHHVAPQPVVDAVDRAARRSGLR